MKNMIRLTASLALALAAMTLPAGGQNAPAGNSQPGVTHFDLAVSYTAKIAKISQQSSSNFVLNGASLDSVIWLKGKAGLKGKLGVAFDLSGETASNIEPGVNLTQFSGVVGPRYTAWQAKGAGYRPNLYTQALVGFVAGSNSVFPQAPGVVARTSAFALQTGGGLNWPLSQHLGWRVFEADYIYTQLPNNASNQQSDLRLSSGINFHF